MGIFNELSKDFNGGFNPAENLGQVLELMNKYSRIRTRTGGFNPIIYNSWNKKQEEKTMPKTVSVNEIEAAINQSTRPQAGFMEMKNNDNTQVSYGIMENNSVQANYQTLQNDTAAPSNIEHTEKETEDIMDM